MVQDVQRYIWVLSKRIWVFAAFFVVVVTLVAIATFRAKPVYRATAQLIEPS